MEETRPCTTIDHARNAAVAWLESWGVVFGPSRKIEIGSLGLLEGSEVGVSAAERPYWRIRLDYDPVKGGHFNDEHGRGNERKKDGVYVSGD